MAPYPDIVFIIKGNENNGRNMPSCPFPALMIPFPDKAFINEQVTGFINEDAIGSINEAPIGAIIAPKDPPPCFVFIHVLLFQ